MMTNTPKFRFHVIGLPHTAASKAYVPCAFTQNVLNFCKMMMSLGHEVYHYGGEGSEAPCTEQIDIITKRERAEWWGNNNWKKDFFAIDYDLTKPYWQTANQRTIEELKKRIQPRDFICVIGGMCHKPIADAFPNHMTVEFAVGHYGTFAKYKVFASYALMHYVYGKRNQEVGFNFDAVIPHYFDQNDFIYKARKGDYYLFAGRLITNKGVYEAIDITEAAGEKLVVVGQGKLQGTYSHVKHLGTVGVRVRAELMASAKALFVPSRYIEPFGNVVAEAMFCGTPVIATDWGAFAETVKHGQNGFRIRSLGEGLRAIDLIDTLKPRLIRKFAMQNFSLDVVRYKYQAYFEQLMELWGDGWYSTKVSDQFTTRYN